MLLSNYNYIYSKSHVHLIIPKTCLIFKYITNSNAKPIQNHLPCIIQSYNKSSNSCWGINFTDIECENSSFQLSTLNILNFTHHFPLWILWSLDTMSFLLDCSTSRVLVSPNTLKHNTSKSHLVFQIKSCTWIMSIQIKQNLI